MNIQTGDLYRIKSDEELRQLRTEQGEMLQEVPDKYAELAEAILGNADTARVDMSAHTPLVGWANKQRIALKNRERAARKRQNRARATKSSRKQNRGKS